MRPFKYVVYALLFFICILTSGCSGKYAVRYEKVIEIGTDTYMQKSDNELKVDELVIDTMTLPICAYGTADVLGEAEEIREGGHEDQCRGQDQGQDHGAPEDHVVSLELED